MARLEPKRLEENNTTSSFCFLSAKATARTTTTTTTQSQPVSPACLPALHLFFSVSNQQQNADENEEEANNSHTKCQFNGRMYVRMCVCMFVEMSSVQMYNELNEKIKTKE